MSDVTFLNYSSHLDDNSQKKFLEDFISSSLPTVDDYFQSLLENTDVSNTLLEIFKVLKKLEDQDAEVSIRSNVKLSEVGWGIQSSVLKSLNIPFTMPSPARLLEIITDICETPDSYEDSLPLIIPEADSIVLSENIWVGRELGVDFALIFLKVDSEFLVIEGSVARPTLFHYKGKSKEEALSCLLVHLTSRLRD